MFAALATEALTGAVAAVFAGTAGGAGIIVLIGGLVVGFALARLRFLFDLQDD